MSEVMTEDEKKWIDDASYDSLLSKWRFAEAGNNFFTGETGDYFAKVMAERKEECDSAAASKRVGWGD